MALKKKENQGTVIHRALARSFMSTLYSLDVVTVNLSISFPGFKKGAYKEGLESSQHVKSARSAPPSPLQLSARPSSHQHKILTVWSYLLLSFSTTPFIFQSKKIFLWICFFVPISPSPCRSHSSPFLFPQARGQGSSFPLILCLIITIFLNST